MPENPDHPDPTTAEPAPAAPAAEETPSKADTAAAFLRWQLQAASIADADRQPMGAADGVLAHYNARRGVAAVLPLQSTLAAKLPATDWSAIGRIPDLALAVIHAEAVADGMAADPSAVPGLRTTVYADRKVLLNACDALVDAGLLPAHQVAAVREGRGAADAATDIGVLAGLLRANWAAIQNNTALTGERIDTAAATAKQLLDVLRPDAGRPGPKDERVADAQKTRDQLWTLLVQQYEEAQVVGYMQWRGRYEQFVPGLRARKG